MIVCFAERAVALGKLGFSYGAGVIIGPFIGGQISKYFSQKAALMSAAFLSVFAIIVVITFIPKFTRKIGRQLTSFISSYYCPYHLNIAYLIFSAMSTTPHLLISSFHNVSDQLSFISSYYVSIPSQSCIPHLCNVYHSTSSDLFIP